LFADLAEPRIDRQVVLIRGLAIQDPARAVPRPEGRVFRVVRQLRLFLGVEVVQVAVEFVEAVDGRQELVPVAEVVLAELPGGVAERLEQPGDRRIFLTDAQRRAGEADLGEPGSQAVLAGDEGRTACRELWSP